MNLTFLRRLVIAGFAFVFISTLFLNSSTSAQNLQDFSFESFSADYYLSQASDKSSRLEVKETLVALFPNFDQNHGILRAIPKVYENHDLGLKIVSVADESGQPHLWETYKQNDNLVLKIGDPDKYVRGRATYNINYTMRDVVNFQPDFDQFYWDINGDQWAQNFGSVTARVHIPNNLQNSITGPSECFTGSFGDQTSNCLLQQVEQNGEQIITATANNLNPYQTLTVRTKFQPGTFAKSQEWMRAEQLQKISQTTGAILVGILPLGAFWFMFRRWRQFGDDPKGRGVIVPHYTQPKDFNALTSDFLYKQALRPQAISAMLIELAIQGYISISEIPKKGWFGSKDYELELKKSASALPDTVKKVLTGLFDSLNPGSKVSLSIFKKDYSARQDFYEAMKKVEADLAENMHTLGYFMKNPKKVKAGYQIWGAAIFCLALIVGGISLFALNINWALLGGAVGLLLASLVLFIFSHLMPARTEKGVATYDEILGLEDYIKMAEADRLRYLQSPEGAEKISDQASFDPKTDKAKVKLFEALLPYAMLFGLEKQWAKQFEGFYTKRPDWYHGDWSTFNAAYLASSVSDFSKAGGSSFSSPSSSTGSGGGSAGGGGGGGGGGGW